MKKPIYWLIGVAIFAVLVYMIVIYVVPSPADATEAVQCSGKTVYRYKKPDAAFSLVTNNYTISLQMASGVLDNIAKDTGTSTVGIGVKNDARNLAEQLDQENIFIQNSFKTVFILSNNDPCNDSLRYLCTTFINNMAQQQTQLREFLSQVTASPAETKNTGADTGSKQVLAVIDTSRGVVDSTAKAIQKAPADKLVVLRNPPKLNSAVSALANKYKPFNFKQLHQ